MPMTMTQKILAAHCGRETLAAGEMISPIPTWCWGTTLPRSVKYSTSFIRQVMVTAFSIAGKIALVMDHFTPTRTSKRRSKP